MSTQDISNDITVEDEDALVDRKTKEHVLNLRQQVDQTELQLYVELQAAPASDVSIAEANEYWGTVIRQYLRGIKRLWSNTPSDVHGAGDYWQDKLIGREVLTPPDTERYQFSAVEKAGHLTEQELKRVIGLPKHSEIPEPVEVPFHGLNSILSKNRIGHTWHVKTDMSGPPPRHETETLSVEMPIPKHVLENAVEAADNFLQQAGLGFEVGVPDYYGNNGPGI